MTGGSSATGQITMFKDNDGLFGIHIYIILHSLCESRSALVTSIDLKMKRLTLKHCVKLVDSGRDTQINCLVSKVHHKSTEYGRVHLYRGTMTLISILEIKHHIEEHSPCS